MTTVGWILAKTKKRDIYNLVRIDYVGRKYIRSKILIYDMDTAYFANYASGMDIFKSKIPLLLQGTHQYFQIEKVWFEPKHEAKIKQRLLAERI